jgi:hypothetical protein
MWFEFSQLDNIRVVAGGYFVLETEGTKPVGFAWKRVSAIGQNGDDLLGGWVF